MDVVKAVLNTSGIKELNPVQNEALKNGLLSDHNLVVSSPTASGKTLIAEIAMLDTARKGKKAIYLVPLVALAGEKYRAFKRKYEPFGLKIALSVGDYDSNDPWLKNYDIIICSNEKLDSLIRHGADWLKDVGLVVVDEIHMIGDSSRGPTLEIVITKLREMTNPRFIALSATIKNSDEIAEWLDAKLVKSQWRPVKLYEGVAFDERINFPEWRDYKIDGGIEEGIVKNTMELGKQVIFFLSSRKNAESLAERLSHILKPKEDEKRALKRISEEILHSLDVPTQQCKKLSSCILNGVAFHHAGLVSRQKELVEETFRKGLIKVICATPTLAMGVSLPAFRVVVRDIKRYYPGVGMVYIPVLEYKQLVGRAGRPEFNEHGEGIIVARNEREVERLVNQYVFGEPEEIYSKLALEPALRTHVLSLICDGTCRSREDFEKFFSKTFYTYQTGSLYDVMDRIEDILEDLRDWNFIDGFKPTTLGRRISELYIDPLSAHRMIEGIKGLGSFNELSFLHIISNTIEMSPRLRVSDKEYEEVSELLFDSKDYLPKPIPNEWDIEFESYIESFKTALLFADWINEKTEEELLEKYNVTPGELRNRLTIADWLLYACEEILKILGKIEMIATVRKLRLRMKYGVKDDLLELVKVKGIGRVRARKLADNGIKTIKQLRRVPLSYLEELLGSKIANSIKREVEKLSNKVA